MHTLKGERNKKSLLGMCKTASLEVHVIYSCRRTGSNARGLARDARYFGIMDCSYNYMVTAHKPTNVTHSAVGHFTNFQDINLIISCAPLS